MRFHIHFWLGLVHYSCVPHIFCVLHPLWFPDAAYTSTHSPSPDAAHLTFSRRCLHLDTLTFRCCSVTPSQSSCRTCLRNKIDLRYNSTSVVTPNCLAYFFCSVSLFTPVASNHKVHLHLTRCIAEVASMRYDFPFIRCL